MSRVVDLPAPFGPSRATVSPGSIDEVDARDGLHRAVGLGEAAQLDAGRARRWGKRFTLTV